MSDVNGARLVGTLIADGEGGEVFEANGAFFALGSTLVINGDEDEVVEVTRSEDFPSLEALLASQPSGVRFVPATAGGDGGGA
jgi:hypothetical protein